MTTTFTPKPCGTTAAWMRHRRHDEPIDIACRNAHNTYEATRKRELRAEARRRKAAQAAERLAHRRVRVFYGLRCTDCGAGLVDNQGQPCWDILWPLRFVCVGGCRGGEQR